MADARPTPASVNDTWNAVGGDDHAHLFPDGGLDCLCGWFLAPEKRAQATCIPPDERDRPTTPNRVYRVYRPYCPECLTLQDARWGLVKVAPPPQLAS